MGEVQCRDRGLAYVGVGMAWQRPKPRLDRIYRLHHAGEVASLDHLLDQTQLLVRNTRIDVPDSDGGGDVGLPNQVGTEFLQRSVGVDSLVGGVGVEKG